MEDIIRQRKSSQGSLFRTTISGNQKWYQEAMKKDPFGTKQKAEEMVSQDIFDIVSFESVVNFAPKDAKGQYNWDLIKGIRKNAWDIKDRYRAQFKLEKDGKETAADGRAKLDLEASDYRERVKKEYGQKYAKLFDSYMLSSLRPQEESFAEFKKNRVTRIQKMIDQYNINGQKKEARELAKKLNASDNEIKKEWMATNFDTFPAEWNFLSGDVLQWYGQRYNQIAQAVSRKSLSYDEIKILNDYAESKHLDEDTRYEYPDLSAESTMKQAFKLKGKLPQLESDEQMDKASAGHQNSISTSTRRKFLYLNRYSQDSR